MLFGRGLAAASGALMLALFTVLATLVGQARRARVVLRIERCITRFGFVSLLVPVLLLAAGAFRLARSTPSPHLESSS